MADGYAPIEPNANGALHCEQLDLDLFLEEGNLIMQDSVTGQRLQTSAEAGWVGQEAERVGREVAEAKLKTIEAERDAERIAREAAEARARALEEEWARFRARFSDARPDAEPS